ncbi:MAG: hypothetical protein A3B30_03165 [Candidatus Komeilibacteria bacterium RIFCSPLOWO2_01_FULL_52_15]|uniref:Uncharacterized protein n=2 Tax=Candidatus Komeiliibacteriota TaxID=1817908 RepID=A0A1G2BMU5_9BACT|nr:MAG: hypothetical protein A2677_03600 [Candidatus Komeilibacteria bacterium RIFCSPHIGHO2_01_FULL_52_14]OGY90451.1 MAG: hypothetical protein A3B30_03165 [Candidatus Komeilibacteria bacterium RIFCSPLOWO2_01_FULL_52_15]
MKKHLLFVCSGNLDRSPTAEALFSDSKQYMARSAGTHEEAVRRINQELIDWADSIFVMSEKEDGHLTFLKTHLDLKGRSVYDLDVPDRWDRDDPELIQLLIKKLRAYLTL